MHFQVYNANGISFGSIWNINDCLYNIFGVIGLIIYKYYISNLYILKKLYRKALDFTSLSQVSLT